MRSLDENKIRRLEKSKFVAKERSNERIYIMNARILTTVSFVVCLIMVPTVGHTAENWTMGTPMTSSWNGTVAVTLDGKIFLFGGMSEPPTYEIDIVRAYDPQQDSWQGMTPMPEGRVQLAAAAVGDSIYLFGGMGGSYVKSTVWKYTPASEGTPQGPWRTDLHPIGYPFQPGTEFYGYAVACEGKIYLFGGRYAPTVVPYVYADWHWYSTTWCYDPTTDTWGQKADMPLAGSIPPTAVGSKIYLVGGELQQYMPSGQLWVYDTVANVWNPDPLPNFPGGTVWGQAVGTINGFVYVAGGIRDWVNPTALPWTWRYDPEARQWQELEPMPVPVMCAANAACNGNFYLFGGSPGYGAEHGLIYTQILNVEEPPIETAIDIDPDVLNLKSRGRWITCYVWLPEDYDVADVDADTILLNGEIGPAWSWIDEAEQMLMAKFPRSQAQEMLEPGEVELTVTGELLDGTKFEGSDTIRVIDKGGKK